MRKLKNEELNRISVEEFKTTEKTPLIIILDNIRSLNNIGSVFRTADAFLVEAIYLCGITACPPHKDIQKTALGATETIKWDYFKDTAEAVELLQKQGYKVLAIEQADNSIMLDSYTPIAKEKTAVIFGHEVNGVEENIVQMANACIEIPQYGSKHSLNISVCAGIVIWDLFLKLK
jgi:23S rRNA (guanosine2251-2'-O)-methyltransferase